jgi:hypothetical protein
MMRKQVRQIVLLMSLIEALRIGPLQIVYAGSHGYPAKSPETDFGIAYTMGYVLSWLYVCIFMIIWVPFFQWWVERLFPASEDPNAKPGMGGKIVEALKRFNMVLLPMSIGIALITYAYYLVHTFIYVDTRVFNSNKLPKNTRKNWAARLFMLVGIAISTSSGYGAFQILADYDLAHVKAIEYLIIVVPVQINLGILFGSLFQRRMEKRAVRKEASAIAAVKAQENATADEKAALLDV